ncbi:hypothetical protein ACHAWX_000875 [Stephanocyclus meneghinianus]
METPSNKRKADSGIPYPDDLVPRVRAKAVSKLPPDLISSIRELLATNKEVFDRCMKSKVHNDDDNDSTSLVTCRRKVFNVVASSNDSERTEFGVVTTTEKKDFDIMPLVQLSSGLDLFQPTFVLGCIDFNALFETSLLLDCDILLPFLDGLKDHLELVKICLSSIEEWLMESRDSKIFLGATFGTQLDDHSEDESDTDYDEVDQCRICGKQFKSYLDTRRCHFCPYPVFTYKVLKRTGMDAKLEDLFDLNDEHERAKLIKCLESTEDMEKNEVK